MNQSQIQTNKDIDDLIINSMNEQLITKGNWLKKVSLFEQAQEIFEQAILNKPIQSEAYYNLGITFMYKGQMQIAKQMFEQAFKNSKKNIQQYNNKDELWKNFYRITHLYDFNSQSQVQYQNQ